MHDIMELLDSVRKEYADWLPWMKPCVVTYRTEEVFQSFQSAYYWRHGEHLCYTLSDWLALDKEAKAQLVDKPLMLIKPPTETLGLSATLLVNAKAIYLQESNSIVPYKDLYWLKDRLIHTEVN